jgi:predicted alpha/beta hydrolase family esterase
MVLAESLSIRSQREDARITNDPYSRIQFAENCAKQWGSRFINVGAAGHINSSSDLGVWPRGLASLHELRDDKESLRLG